jgi:hypothetical protein
MSLRVSQRQFVPRLSATHGAELRIVSKFKVLIFQQLKIEHPAIFREFFATDWIEWQASQIPEYRESLEQIAGAYGRQR